MACSRLDKQVSDTNSNQQVKSVIANEAADPRVGVQVACSFRRSRFRARWGLALRGRPVHNPILTHNQIFTHNPSPTHKTSGRGTSSWSPPASASRSRPSRLGGTPRTSALGLGLGLEGARIYIYIYIYTYIYIYIYTQHMYTYIYIYIYTQHMYTYIHIYIYIYISRISQTTVSTRWPKPMCTIPARPSQWKIVGY